MATTWPHEVSGKAQGPSNERLGNVSKHVSKTRRHDENNLEAPEWRKSMNIVLQLLECAVEVYPVGINTTRTVHLFTRSGTDNRRVQKVADRGHTQKCHTTPEGPRSLHAATP